MTDGKTKYVSIPEDAWELAGGIVLSGEHDEAVARAEAAEAKVKDYELTIGSLVQADHAMRLLRATERKLKALQEAIKDAGLSGVLYDAIAKSKE